jgi:flagellar hook assembly protein FlgD
LLVAGQVSLKVYDALGREVGTIVNQQLNAGSFNVSWDASQYTTGIYFYRLTAGDYTETKKMLLIK